ncbi:MULTISPECIES: metallophosphoesterase [unclassified Microbacterium]|uniref:metallophosphoesterase family protein n=1 Tax=unclassified Microbacterium TaxID=2609290 RepID=UPI001604C981|nr:MULTISPECIES: metallophosphoesterase [unclassified Microbacterium]QNA91604.1 metallophosphoesterase [Microbacterium sp. Se63.02b]QYM64785.1 metallophosphoesterase [Microbacterium sp. Se5.02b]
MKLVQITDTHISHLGGSPSSNAERFVAFINDMEPDLVVHTGDVTILDPDEDRDRVAAKEILAGISAPLLVLPGNHDVGEPGDDPFGDRPVTSDRIAAFRAHFGIDRFVEVVDGWAVVGFNSELFDSGLPEEAEQWTWLESLPGQVGPRPVVVFTHKPVWAYAPEYQNTHLTVGPDSLPRLEAVLAQLDVRAFGSGHLHHYALTEREGAAVVSAPSTAFVHRGAVSADIVGPGLAQLGVVEYELGERVLPSFRAPLDIVEPEFLEVEPARIALDAMGVTL